MEVNDPRLAERIRERDPETIGAVVQQYLPQILRAARGAGLTPERAEDVAQSTFSTFIESASRFEGRSHVRTWLFGILFKKIAENRRAEQRALPVDDIEKVMEQRFDSSGNWSQPPLPLDEQVYQREARAAIDACLGQAPTSQRMAFVLREVEGFSTEEICKILEVSRTNLGVLLFRVRNRLRECLESKGVRR